MAGLAAEVLIVLFSFGVFILYHVWFFGIHGTGLRTTKPKPKGRDDLFLKGKVARISFVDLVCRDNDTIQGIQQNRNALIGVAFLAATMSLLAQKILSIILDLDQRDQMKAFADNDPIVGDVQISPGVVLGVNFVLLMISMLAFGQAVRMYIHAGYFYKAAALGGGQAGLVTVADTAEVVIHAQVAQTIGMRILFFFPVTALWLIGPTAMLMSSIVTMAITAYLDFHFYDDKSFAAILADVQQRDTSNA